MKGEGIMPALAVSSTVYLLAVWLYAAGPDPAPSPAFASACLVAITVFYFIAAYCALKTRGTAATAVIIFFAILLRFAAWHISPVYTTDYYRYAWDGKVSASGINPYAHAPGAEELNHLRNGKNFNKINYKKVPTGYGPAAEALFFAIYKIAGENSRIWRAIFFLMEAVVLALVFALVAQAGVPPARAAIYAYNPLVLLELCSNIHIDSLMMIFILLCFMAAFAGRKRVATALLCGAALVKFFPALLFPAAVSFSHRDKPFSMKDFISMGAIFCVVLAAPIYFYSRGGVDFFAGLKFFASGLTPTKFSPYYFIESLSSPSAARALCASMMIVCSFAALAHSSRNHKYLFLIFLLTFITLFSPAQRPWYFVWAIPFCCVRPVYSVLLMSCLSLLTYAFMYTYDLIYPAKAIIYAVFYVSLVVETMYEFKLKAFFEKWTKKNVQPAQS